MKIKETKWVLLILLALIWGSSFILIKFGLTGLSVIQVGSFRIICAAIFLLSIGYKTLPNIPRYYWKYIALTSLFGTFIPAFLFSLAETQIDSSIAAILNSLTPLNTLLIGVIIFGLPAIRNQLIGVFIGLIGCLILVLNGASNHPNQNYYYAILVIIASICYAINVNLIKKYLSDLSPLTIATGNFAVMFVPALLIFFSSGISTVSFNENIYHSMFFIMILGVAGTGIANIIFFKLIQISSPIFATSVTYLIPIVAFFWGLLDQEKLSFVQLIGAFVVLVGVYLSSKK